MSKEERKIYSIVTAAVIAGYIWLAYALTTGAGKGGFCYIKSLTGMPCPSCGSTRSVVSLLHGDLLTSMMTNPFGLIIAAIMVILPIWLITDLILRKKSFYNFYRNTEQIIRKPIIAMPMITLVLINWIWNISKGL